MSAIFDPLGLVSPFILRGKRILQKLCQEGVGWDDPIDDKTRYEWEQWYEEIHQLSDLRIQRCYKPENFGVIKEAEFHHFSDASMEGPGQCTYLRLKDDQGQVHTTLVMAKSRVVPSKPITVPRLELSAALMSVRVSQFIEKELGQENIPHYFWTDSQIVLGYINNDAKRFHVFVANRVQEIREHTSPSSWQHVKIFDNPADIASRGVKASDLINSSLWWHGPQFLQDDKTALKPNDFNNLDPEDPEVRKITTHSIQVNEENKGSSDFLSRLDRFSNWTSAKRAIALCVRFMMKLRSKEPKKSVAAKSPDQKILIDPVSVQEMQNAERIILQHLQRQEFPQEILGLQKLDRNPDDRQATQQRNRVLKKSSRLHNLDPFLSDEGLLHVGGRIKRSGLSDSNPVILPATSHVTELIIDHYHKRCGHAGRGITLNTLRSSGFWLIHGGTSVSKHIWKCVPCRRLRGPQSNQKMADLPEDRLTPAPPFTYSAVDCFGPFLIKEGRKVLKRYGILFNCLVSRAVHVEVAASMSTDSFLNAYRRFVCRRGPIRSLRSDQGTNFIGAISQMDEHKIQNTLNTDNCDLIKFNMNVPHASHMGGAWERMIRSVRNALNGLLMTHSERLDEESFRTLLTEAEAIVNSRPLTSLDSESPIALSPNQLLTLKSDVIMPPPGNFVKEDLYCHRRWRCVQYLANEFWIRWKRDFLPSLQTRTKWIHTRRNLETGDVVLMIDDSLPRNKWPLARVIETYVDEDGLVRKVKIQCRQSSYDRPIHQLILLQESQS